MAIEQDNEREGPLGRNRNYVESPRDKRARLTSHLDALLVSFTGDGFDSFKRWNEDIQHELLSLAAALAAEIHGIEHQETQVAVTEASHG
jgi:uncharacterized protein YukE